jgi:hypothetical protein
MKKLILILLILLSIVTPLVGQTTNYNPGTTAPILSAVTTTGTGTCYALLNRGAIPANFTWQTVISGGTATSITVVFEGSLNNDCSNPTTIDTSTSTSGETRSIANKAYPYVTANITAYSRNGTTATVNFVAQYGSGLPTPTAANQCFVSQGTFQGSWTWAACSGAGGSVTNIATTAPITGGPITTTGTVACATCVTSSSPGAGVAHFAGSTQAVTSSAVALGSDVSGQLPIGNVGSAGLSGVNGLTVAATGVITPTSPYPLCKFSAAGNGNDQTQDVIAQCTITSGTLGTTSGLYLNAQLNTVSGGATCVYSVQFSNSTSAGSGNTLVTSGATSGQRTGIIEAWVTNQSSASAQGMAARYTASTGTTITGGSGSSGAYNTGSATTYLTVTGQANASTANTCNVVSGMVMLIP